MRFNRSIPVWVSEVSCDISKVHNHEACLSLFFSNTSTTTNYLSKCSHTFNLLDARGAVSVTERAGYLSRIRNMAKSVAKVFVAERKKLGYPLIKDEKLRQELLKEEK